MTFPDSQSVLYLYQEIVTAGLLQYLQKQTDSKVRRGIYCARVVLWLMMLQRLHRGATPTAKLPSTAKKKYLRTHRRLLPSAAEIGDAVVQASE